MAQPTYHQDGNGVLDLVVLALHDWEEGGSTNGGWLQALGYRSLEDLHSCSFSS